MKIDKRFQRLLEECKNELDYLDIKYYNIQYVEVNTRAKNRWGQCRKDNRNNTFSINLSNELLKTTDKDIKDTLIHELLHTVDGCLNHGDMWKKYADKVNRAFGYNIKRRTSNEDKGLKTVLKTASDYKYNVVCPNCGKTYHYARKCKVIDNLHRYNCNICKCNKLELKVNF